jgi:hypothetical protein
VQFAVNPVVALKELRRVCTAGGRIVVTIWAAPEFSDSRMISEAVRGPLPSPPSGGGPFALSAPGVLEGLLEQADLRVIGGGEVDAPIEQPDLDTYWQSLRSTGPTQAAIRAVGEDRVKAAALQAAEKFRTPTGDVRLNNRYRYVAASR